MGGRILAVGGRSLPTEGLTDGRCTSVLVSVLSEEARDGAIVDAMDIVRLLSLPVEDAMLVALVWAPG